MDTNQQTNKIVGAWDLKSYSVTKQNDQSVLLWGANVSGLLIYLANGYMSVQVSNNDRALFAKADFLAGSVEEITAAFEGYTAYFGMYQYQPENKLVCHFVEQSLYPNWSGITHTRFATLENSTLILKTPPIQINGELCNLQMNWEKIT